MRMLIVDDHPVFLSGLRNLLGALDSAEVVGEATSGAEAVSAARELSPDIVLMDIEMPGMDGIEATQAIMASCPNTAVLILTMFEDNDKILAALRSGASGFLPKGAGLDDIRRAIEAVGHGNLIIGASVAGSVAEQLIRPPGEAVPFPELTLRERAVLELVASGRNNSQIARDLSLSVKTVRNYLSRIFTKLQVAHRTEAAVVARRHGLGH